MKILGEEEEDVHLDDGQRAEENIFSVDYDVWVDETSDYVKIEKYKGHLHAEKSPTCGYYTLRVVREEIIESPTLEREGTLVKHYECSYTRYKTQRVFNIARLKAGSRRRRKYPGGDVHTVLQFTTYTFKHIPSYPPSTVRLIPVM